MAKKKNLSRKEKEEKIQPITTAEQDTQYDVVPKDEASPPESSEETLTQEVTQADEPEAKLEVIPEVSSESISETQTPDTQPQEPKAKPKPLTMISLKQELDDLKATVQSQSQQIADLLSGPVLKRKPVANSRVKIKDTQTGRVYPSKNNVYTSFLREGLLDDLIKKGVFGEVPTKNSFGWYALNRTFPGRFVEVEESQNEAK